MDSPLGFEERFGSKVCKLKKNNPYMDFNNPLEHGLRSLLDQLKGKATFKDKQIKPRS